MTSPSRRWIGSLTLVVMATGLWGCLAVEPVADFTSQAPTIAPEAFFNGSTHSWGMLESRAGAPSKAFQVEGHGHIEPDGSLRLDQTVSFEGAAPKLRTWRLRRIDPHHYAATLADAAGEVRAEAYGPLLHLQYATKSPFAGTMEQWLYLQADGRTVLNEATVRIAGVTVARLSERISRDTGPAGAISP